MIRERPPVLDRIVAFLRERPFVERIILFGSRARGDHRERSDFDIAISCPNARKSDLGRLRLDADEDLDTLFSVDLIWLEDADEALRQEIEREGRVIYERGAQAA